MLKADLWLSQILGWPAYQLSGTAFVPPEGRAFVSVKLATHDIDALILLQAQGFTVMDTNVQLLRPAGGMPAGSAGVRLSTAEDEDAVREIASTAFTLDRFHRDPSIGHETASRLKAEWAGNYFRGTRGERMIVAEDEEGVCGFLQLLHDADGGIVIDLIAVSARARGRGMARSMIASAANSQGVCAIGVGTQIANIPSLALYEGLGFRIVGAAYVLHLHIGA